MKRYVFLTHTITGIGGSIIYTNNKRNYLEEEFWKVDIISSSKGDVLVKYLYPYRGYIFTDLIYPPYLFSESKRSEIIDSLLKTINPQDKDNIVIESHTITMALWGELIATKIRAKHFVFLLCETFDIAYKEIYKFFDFKHNRKELSGISKESLGMLFKGYKKLIETESYHLIAFCTNAVNINARDEEIGNIQKRDFNIGCITRLEKQFVVKVLEQIIYFANRNDHIKIQLIFFGGSINKQMESHLIAQSKKVKNLNVLITGFLFPIPGNIFEKADVFVGTAGSAWIPADAGMLTISVDTRDGSPLGILGFDTVETTYGPQGNRRLLSDLLQQILEEGWHRRKDILKIQLPYIDLRQEFSKHMDFLNSSGTDSHYYIFNFLKIDMSSKDKLKKWLLNFLSSDILLSLSILRNKATKLFSNVPYW